MPGHVHRPQFLAAFGARKKGRVGIVLRMVLTIALQRDDEAFHRRARLQRRWNFAAVAVYAAAVVVALFNPIVAILLFTAVSLAYIAPQFPPGGRRDS